MPPIPIRPFRNGFSPSLPFTFLLVLLSVIWLAGGASRADALGQAVVRAVAWGGLAVLILLGNRSLPRLGTAPWLFLGAMIFLVAIQLVPLPPAMWQALPGRAMLVDAAALGGQPQPWRPVAILPSAAANALASLIVPVAVLAFASHSTPAERAWMPAILLGLVTASMLVGLLQFSGAGFNNPFINDAPGDVSGTFANRNHFALLLAIGCVLAPAWAFADARQGPRWRVPVALGLVLIFVLTILASGSRAGIVVGALALGIGLLLVRGRVRRQLRRAPRWMLPVLAVALLVVVAGMVLVSVSANRAVSIDRAMTIEAGEDMRSVILPTLQAMIGTYFPVGSGWGGFDAAFRISEPDALLQLAYLNRAHNDYLETVLDGGLPAMILLLAAVGWWVIASVRAWRIGSERGWHPRLGSAVLLLVIIASAVDYPARTPMIMAMLAIAAMWLNEAVNRSSRSALPPGEQQL